MVKMENLFTVEDINGFYVVSFFLPTGVLRVKFTLTDRSELFHLADLCLGTHESRVNEGENSTTKSVDRECLLLYNVLIRTGSETGFTLF